MNYLLTAEPRWELRDNCYKLVKCLALIHFKERYALRDSDRAHVGYIQGVARCTCTGDPEVNVSRMLIFGFYFYLATFTHIWAYVKRYYLILDH